MSSCQLCLHLREPEVWYPEYDRNEACTKQSRCRATAMTVAITLISHYEPPPVCTRRFATLQNAQDAVAMKIIVAVAAIALFITRESVLPMKNMEGH